MHSPTDKHSAKQDSNHILVACVVCHVLRPETSTNSVLSPRCRARCRVGSRRHVLLYITHSLLHDLQQILHKRLRAVCTQETCPAALTSDAVSARRQCTFNIDDDEDHSDVLLVKVPCFLSLQSYLRQNLKLCRVVRSREMWCQR